MPPETIEAVICSFECTFCAGCAENVLNGVCPNCGGELAKRPSRAARLLTMNPASVQRIVKRDGCLKVEKTVLLNALNN